MPTSLLRLKRLSFMTEFDGPSVDDRGGSFVDVPVDCSRFGFSDEIIADASSAWAEGFAFEFRDEPSDSASTPVRSRRDGKAPDLVNTIETGLLAALLDDRSVRRLCRTAPVEDLAELMKTLGDDFEPFFPEDGRPDLAWLARGIAEHDASWLADQFAILDRVNDELARATEGRRTLFLFEDYLSASARIALREIDVRIRMRSSLLGRLLAVLHGDRQEEDAPSSSCRSPRAPADVAA